MSVIFLPAVLKHVKEKKIQEDNSLNPFWDKEVGPLSHPWQIIVAQDCADPFHADFGKDFPSFSDFLKMVCWGESKGCLIKAVPEFD